MDTGTHHPRDLAIIVLQALAFLVLAVGLFWNIWEQRKTRDALSEMMGALSSIDSDVSSIRSEVSSIEIEVSSMERDLSHIEGGTSTIDVEIQR